MTDIVTNEGESLRDILRKADQRAHEDHPNGNNGRSAFAPREPQQEVQTPPHPEEVETAIGKRMDAFLEEQGVMAQQRLNDLYAEMEALTDALKRTQKRASIALRAHSEALVSLRKHAEASSALVKELTNGLEHVDDMIRNA